MNANNDDLTVEAGCWSCMRLRPVLSVMMAPTPLAV